MRSRIVAVLIAALALGGLALAEGERALNQAKILWQKAEREFRRGKTDGAERYLRRALELIPDYSPAHLTLGHLAMQAADFPRALDHYEKARDGYASLGEQLRDVEFARYAEAQREIALLEDSLQQAKYASIGMTPLEISKIENALARLYALAKPDEEPIHQPPGELYFYLGNAHWQLGNHEEARGAWETCRERAPEFALVHNNLALAYWRLDRFDDALAELERAEELGFKINPLLRADIEADAKAARAPSSE